jgi:hypothetical protein
VDQNTALGHHGSRFYDVNWNVIVGFSSALWAMSGERSVASSADVITHKRKYGMVLCSFLIAGERIRMPLRGKCLFRVLMSYPLHQCLRFCCSGAKACICEGSRIGGEADRSLCDSQGCGRRDAARAFDDDRADSNRQNARLA